MSELDQNLEDALAKDSKDHELNTAISNLEKKGDNEEHDELADVTEEDDKRDSTDYSNFTKADFVKKAEELVGNTNLKDAHETFKKIRVLFDDAIKAERIILIKEWADAGHEVRDFKPPYDEQKESFYKAYTKFLEKRADEKKLAEEEKKKNLNAKKAILDKLRELTSNDETEKAFEDVRELQKQWRQIRTVPREHMQELWDNYRFLLEKFYDNHTINRELKELDREKNLEAKIDLIKKVSLLQEEKSIKKTYILLNKYHEDFKNTGPVNGKDVAEDIWKRFKEASDKVLNEKKAVLDEIKAKRTENLELKKVLCEKIELINQVPIENAKVWKEKTDEIAAIFNEWKGIGPVPESVNDQIWKRFREAQNIFNHHKKAFFDKLNSGREENLKAKTRLCEEVEKLIDNPQFDVASKKIIAFQEQWRNIGPVPEKMNDVIWGRFRQACDTFFNKKDHFYKEKNAGEKENQVAKEAVIEKVKALVDHEDSNHVFQELRKLQQEWMGIGFVPFKVKNDLQTNYNKVIDAIYKKHKQAAEENKQFRMKEHYELLASAPNGDDKLKYEERHLNDKLRILKDDVETLKNNIEFFAKSKNADAYRQQIEQKIASANTQIA
ncbi:MAG: DUF349 domain-containing protein, partial [Bacteroidota bacterium]